MILAGCGQSITDDSVINVQARDIAGWVNDDSPAQLFMDVRDASAFEAGHIPGARNIMLQQVSVTEKDPALEKYSVIVVYGETSGSARAIAMTKRLLSLGHKKVYLLENGYAGWLAQGGASER